MSIRLVGVDGRFGAPGVGWSPVGNSITALQGDVCGLTTGGLLTRLTGSGTAISTGGGVWGILINDFTSDSSGNIINAAAPTDVAATVPAQLALSSYDRRILPNAPIAGVVRGEAQYWTPTFGNIFIQRHKQGTRVNASLIGKKCDLTWNSTTSEWEVDTTSTSVNTIVISEFQLPLYKDNKTYWDSSTYATDTYGAWTCFQIVPAANAEANGLRY